VNPDQDKVTKPLREAAKAMPPKERRDFNRFLGGLEKGPRC
jgi:hypothetical protein